MNLKSLTDPPTSFFSNGIRFSVTTLAPPATRLLKCLYSDRAAISLFDALTPSTDGSEGLVFPADTISKVTSTLAQFIQVADDYHVPRSNVMLFATEAMRRASNAADMLSAIASATGGIGVHVLEPAVETLFGAVMGSRSGLTGVKNGALFLDLGGGSVQMTWVDTALQDYEIKAAAAGKSLPYGAAKLSRILQDSDTSFRAAEVDNLQQSIQSAYDNLCSVFPKLQSIREDHLAGKPGANLDVYMCGGGFRGYGSMLMHNDAVRPYPIPDIGTYTVHGDAFKQVDEMIRINREYDGKIFGMSKRRRSQFGAIATVIRSFIAAVPNIERVTFCKGSNRDGALMMKLPLEIREANPLEVLANVTAEEKALYDGILHKISQALPAEVDRCRVPTILSDQGLGYLFVREIWTRSGHESDTMASYALRNAVSRDPDTPGMTHLARALLGITAASRWDLSYGPADSALAEGLEGIISRNCDEAVFWARYIGAVSNVITQFCPVAPRSADDFSQSIRQVITPYVSLITSTFDSLF